MYIPNYKDVVEKASDGTELAVRGSKWWLISEVNPALVEKPVRASVAGSVSRAIFKSSTHGGSQS